MATTLGNYPGMVTPGTVGSTQFPVKLEDQILAYNFAKQQKADREAEWANAAAKNRAAGRIRHDRFAGTGLNAQGWKTYSPEEIKMRSAFNEVYGPQIAQALQDQRMNAPTEEGKRLRGMRDYWTIRPGGEAAQKHNWTLNMGNTMRSNKVRGMLDRMWRGETDPYLKAVGGGMSAKATLKAMYPSVGGSNPYAWKARH